MMNMNLHIFDSYLTRVLESPNRYTTTSLEGCPTDNNERFKNLCDPSYLYNLKYYNQCHYC